MMYPKLYNYFRVELIHVHLEVINLSVLGHILNDIDGHLDIKSQHHIGIDNPWLGIHINEQS